MKSTSKKRSRSKKVQKRTGIGKGAIAGIVVAVLLFLALIGTLMLILHDNAKDFVSEYEKTHYRKSLYKAETFASQLCVTDADVAMEGYTQDASLHAVGLFDVQGKNVLYADQIFEPLYPASTTKIMTAYVALKYGNLDDIVTASERATDFAEDEQVCGLQAGDQLSLRDLLNGLLLYSGNDCAVAIAEHVSGSVEAFVDKMNEEARNLGATWTHFVNPHGLQNEDHYTTAYDLYLMFNACLQNPQFVEMISQTSYTANLTSASGVPYTMTWEPTNYYASGDAAAPEGVKVIGGKTGTTDEAGSCLVLYEQDQQGRPYISIVMGASQKSILYDNMTRLMSSGINGK